MNTPDKKLIGLSMVRNESDIIEVFARYNLNLLDELHLIDNASSDNTVAIIEALQSEGLPIHLTHHPQHDHTQEQVMTAHMQQLAQRDDIGYFFPLDADELLLVANRAALRAHLSRIPAGHYARIEWENHMCENSTRSAAAIFYQNMSWVRELSPVIFMGKIIVPHALAKQHILAAGNHYIRSPQPHAGSVPAVILDGMKLGHFPIRSKAQLMRKAIMGSLALRMKANKIPHEGAHWMLLADIIRAQNFSLSDEDFRYFSATYDAPKSTQGLSVRVQPVPHFANVTKRYPSEPSELLSDLYDFTVQLCTQTNPPPDSQNTQ